MQGRGVTNYSTSNPTHGFTTSTSEFDDALLQRGIISFEQAMMGKGATAEEANRLHGLKQEEENRKNNTSAVCMDNTSRHNTDRNKDDDDEFLRRYRERRLEELKKEKYGTVIPIQRNEWDHQVNEASKDGTWVVINLTAQKSSPNVHPMHKELCLLVEDHIIPKLANKYPAVKFVSIPSISAIENWPDTNLPTLFCYKNGKLQSQLVGLEEFGVTCSKDSISSESIEFRLGNLGVLEVENMHELVSKEKPYYKKGVGGERGYGKSHSRGLVARLETEGDDGDESDYDDVD